MDHAVVFGAGLAGLLAARVLADRYERVTIVERDRLTEGPRRGVPQGRHAHALLPRGQQIIDELFPGVVAELEAAGAVPYRPLEQARMVLGGQRMCRASTPQRGLALTRPFLEDHVRRRLLALPAVELLDGWDAIAPVIESGRVTGARIGRNDHDHATDGTPDPGGERVLEADLVVDAMGRAGRAATWLGEAGLERPPVEEVEVGVGYGTCYLDLPADALGGDLLVLIGATPQNPRALALFRVEGERWILSAGGMCGDHPPTDPAGFLDFVATVVPESMPDVLPALRAAHLPEQVTPARFPKAVRRRYDRLRGRPLPGLIAAGDATCSVDPLYGQGMSAAALQAIALRDTLAQGRADLELRYFRAAMRVTEPVWQLALTADLAFPGVPGEPALLSRMIGRYVARVQRAATRDPSCALAFARVIGLIDPPSALMRPSILRQTAIHGRR
ncbi:FAD-binding monooxygenase [Nonomuraea sp. NPDC050404]|uniref:NAD(P)/FAD-dependent oxidoreductase n=1 Tax=Nonomuraea sp. NPDC050404 TaxID=3155783 RepID=UPI0033F8DB4C